MLDVTIEFKNKPLFQRAQFSTPLRYQSNLADFSCFFYIREGEYQVIEASGAYQVSKNEALLKKCGNYISNFTATEQNAQAEAIAIYFHPDILQSIYSHELYELINDEESLSTPVKLGNELIDKYINNLVIYLDNPSLIDDDLAVLKFKELIMILMKSQHRQSVRDFFKTLFDSRELEFQKIVENNIFNPLSIEELAFICNKSLSNFKRSFKQHFQESPARYIKQRRLERAAQLLISSPESISGIAYQCCFEDPSTFSSVFLNHFGLSPSQYRNQNRK